MSSINAKTLFHFTHSLSNVISIIQNGIRMGMVTERVPGTDLAYSVEAVCFCDIPLSLIGPHADWYGKYAIGFNLSRMKKLGATPVLYSHPSSKCIPHTNISSKYDMQLLPYIKPMKGLQRKYRAKKPRMKIYNDEKEWRIVGENLTINNVIGENLQQIKEDYQKCLKTSGVISVNPDMIDYLIVEDCQSRIDLINALGTMGYSTYQYHLLISKILVYNEIKKNF